MTEADRIARTRFFALTLMRLGGVAVLMFGLVVWRTDLLRPGGWPIMGLPLCAAGLLGSLLLPRFAARKWRTPER